LECKHTFEVKGLDFWMNLGLTAGDSSAVKYKECPKCKTFIMKCPRYMNQINQTLNDINAIKQIVIEREAGYQA